MPAAIRRQRVPLLLIALMLFALIWISHYLSWQNGLHTLATSNRQQLDQFVAHLESQLARFQFLPELIAKNNLLVELLNDPANPSRVDLVNHYLADINAITGASDTYIMDRLGTTLAASNWQSERPFVGRNFSFRPYFIEAMKGRPGRYFALGITSGERGYFFAYPIIHAAEVTGAVVIKMDLSNIEQRWSNRETQFIVTDPDGVIFITTRPDWLYHSFQPLTSERKQQILLSRRYGNVDIAPLNLQIRQSAWDNSSILESSSTRNPSRFLAQSYDMPEAGWSVMILAPLDHIRNNSLMTVFAVILVFLLLVLLGLLGWQRHRRRQERERFQLEAQKQLEQEVSVRTADLRHEIDEHKRTEQILRDTQDELIQTAKLAVLGQMSASISHELNNPLAAIRSYADNAMKFLTLDKTDQANENLHRIGELTERMGKISSQLKFFARKSSGHLEAVKVPQVIQTALDIVKPQLKNTGIDIHTDQVQANLTVKADMIQLEQVLINLISNAIHAISEHHGGSIVISSERLQDSILIHVEDNGPGIDEADISKIFDPFFTTRKSGLGLGLSISARIIDSMHGRLSATNLPSGGARFSITLPAEDQT